MSSDPYVRIDLNTINGDINIDSVLTKTKKKVIIYKLYNNKCNIHYSRNDLFIVHRH